VIQLIFFFIFTAPSWAIEFSKVDYLNADWSSMHAKILSESVTLTELKLRTGALEVLKAKRELCESQLEGAELPSSCFNLLELEVQLNLLKKAKLSAAWNHIDEICVRTVARMNKIEKEPLFPPNSRCKKSYAERAAKLRYGASLRRGSLIFRHRF
jgi:hypothetical protein